MAFWISEVIEDVFEAYLWRLCAVVVGSFPNSNNNK